MKRVLKYSGLLAMLLLAISFPATTEQTKTPAVPETSSGTTEKAMFAGGCFWCMTGPFEIFNGVISVVSGYAGGTTENPT